MTSCFLAQADRKREISSCATPPGTLGLCSGPSTRAIAAGSLVANASAKASAAACDVGYTLCAATGAANPSASNVAAPSTRA
ncbi:hypothetical protein G6F60_014990 [Rhizopus arrhizus]|nr:hypothetical protein G6F60_014990 [Rhizopus arrhizus]